MADYPFVNLIAYDPEAGALAKGATGTIHAFPYTDGDPVITIKDVSGIEIPGSAVTSSLDGTLPTFTAETDLVVWVSGAYRTVLESTQGMRDAAVSAAASANDAAQTVQSLLPSLNANRVPPGGLSGQVLTKASNADNDVTWLTPSSGGGGTGSGVLVLGADDEIPVGTPALTPIFRLAGAIPTPVDVRMQDGLGSYRSASVTTGAEATDLSISIEPPTLSDVGDLLVVVIAAQSPSEPWEWTLPEGWTSHFESDSGRHLLVASYSIKTSGDLDAISETPQTFLVEGHTGSTRVAASMFRVTGADLDTPVVGVGAWAEGTTTAKTYDSFSASAPAGGQLVIFTANLSGGATEPTWELSPGYQAFSGAVCTDPNSGGKTYVVASHYQVSGLTMPERTETYTGGWSANVWGVSLAIAGA